MLVAVHHLRHAASVRADPHQRDRRHHRHLHPEPRTPQLRSEPAHILHVLSKLQQILQVNIDILTDACVLLAKIFATTEIIFACVQELAAEAVVPVRRGRRGGLPQRGHDEHEHRPAHHQHHVQLRLHLHRAKTPQVGRQQISLLSIAPVWQNGSICFRRLVIIGCREVLRIRLVSPLARRLQ